MERITADDCRLQAAVCREVGAMGAAQVFEDAAFTIEEMDKDIAVLESAREEDTDENR